MKIKKGNRQMKTDSCGSLHSNFDNNLLYSRVSVANNIMYNLYKDLSFES